MTVAVGCHTGGWTLPHRSDNNTVLIQYIESYQLFFFCCEVMHALDTFFLFFEYYDTLCV